MRWARTASRWRRVRAPGAPMTPMTVTVLNMLKMLMAPAWCLASLAQAAPQLTIPQLPPASQGCAAGRHSAMQVAGFDGGAGYLIEAGYDAASGAGHLLRRSLLRVDDGATVGAPAWDAGAVLDGGRPPPDGRRILTQSAAGQALPFEWARLDTAQRAALDPAADGLGEARLAYLRGARTREGNPLRPRASLLGNIVRSRPLLVGAPSVAAASGSASYAAFHQRYRDRQKLLYVGANDGMLHAFDWNDGAERFAYIPAALLPALARLTTAGASGGAGIDAAPGQGEALIGGQWRSTLVSGMAMGARGLFALDVTDPTGDPLVLWEFTERDDAAMGFVQAPPLVVKLRVNGTRGAPVYRYFALTGNGINAADGAVDGVLFLLALDKGAGLPWRHGDNYYRLRASARAPQAANALAPPVLTIGADGSAHSAYAGDLQGTMWRFDLEGIAAAGAQAGAVSPLFHARAADGAAQPVAEAAQVVFAPGGGYLVLFGTGRAIENGDLDAASFVQQSFYAVRDSDARPLAAVAGRAALAQRRLVGRGDGGGFIVEGGRIDYNGSGNAVKHGWYFDFARSLQEGERSAAAPVLSGSAVLINSVAPGSDHCVPALRSYVLDSVSGLPYDRRGLPVASISGAADGAVTGRRIATSDASLPLLLSRSLEQGVATPQGAVRAQRSIAVLQLPAGGPATPVERVVVSSPAGRLSWREIANWRELRAAAIPPALPLP
jgi:type IV pilus assembly protein PilY1